MRTVMADFLILGTSGQSSTGSYAMHTDKTGLFRTAINSFSKNIADVLNRYLVPRLFAANGWKPDKLPKIEVANIDPPDLSQLAELITSTAGAGLQWFPNPTLEKFIFDIAGLPEMPEDYQEHQEQMFSMSQMSDEANSQMQLLGLKQSAEATAQGVPAQQAMQGMSPEDHQMQQMQQGMGIQQQGIANAQQAMTDPNKPEPVDPNQQKQSDLKTQQLGTDAKSKAAIAAEKIKQAKIDTQTKQVGLKNAKKPPVGALRPTSKKPATPGKKN
jgi:hypothetical protein